MQTSPEAKKRICAMFDSFCKTVIQNFSRNLKRAAANQSKYFSTENLLVQYLLDFLTCEDNRPSKQYMAYLNARLIARPIAPWLTDLVKHSHKT